MKRALVGVIAGAAVVGGGAWAITGVSSSVRTADVMLTADEGSLTNPFADFIGGKISGGPLFDAIIGSQAEQANASFIADQGNYAAIDSIYHNLIGGQLSDGSLGSESFAIDDGFMRTFTDLSALSTVSQLQTAGLFDSVSHTFSDDASGLNEGLSAITAWYGEDGVDAVDVTKALDGVDASSSFSDWSTAMSALDTALLGQFFTDFGDWIGVGDVLSGLPF